jgi:hypothetical protein
LALLVEDVLNMETYFNRLRIAFQVASSIILDLTSFTDTEVLVTLLRYGDKPATVSSLPSEYPKSTLGGQPALLDFHYFNDFNNKMVSWFVEKKDPSGKLAPSNTRSSLELLTNYFST